MNVHQLYKIGGYVLALSLLCFLCFFQITDFHSVDYDDPAYISQNIYVTSGIDTQNLAWAWTYEESKGSPSHAGITNLYHPLTWMSHMIDVEVFGVANEKAYHFTNLLLHWLNTLLVFYFILLLSKKHWVAFFTAALFCIHPLHVESVAWLSARKDLLSGFCFFVSLIAYTLAQKKNKILCFSISVFFFLCALLSKPSVVILPGILVLIDYYQKRLDLKSWKNLINSALIHKLPWILPSLAIAFIALSLQHSGSHSFFAEQNSHLSRILSIPVQLSFYIFRTFYPVDLSFHYPFPSYNFTVLLMISLFFWGGIFYLAKKHLKKHPQLFFALMWFLICILPMSGIAYVGTSFTTDRYTYLSLTGVFFLISHFSIIYLPRYWGHCALFSISTACSIITFKQTQVWTNSAALFTHAIQARPKDPTGYSNLASLYSRENKTDEAIELYERSLEIEPSSYIAHYNIGYIQHYKKHNLQQAIVHYEKSLELYPNYLLSLQKLSDLYIQMGLYTLAEPYSTRANTLTHYKSSNLLNTLIQIQLNLGKFAPARENVNRLKTLPRLSHQLKEQILQYEKFLQNR